MLDLLQQKIQHFESLFNSRYYILWYIFKIVDLRRYIGRLDGQFPSYTEFYMRSYKLYNYFSRPPIINSVPKKTGLSIWPKMDAFCHY